MTAEFQKQKSTICEDNASFWWSLSPTHPEQVDRQRINMILILSETDIKPDSKSDCANETKMRTLHQDTKKDKWFTDT